MECVQVNNRVNGSQGPVLPAFYQFPNFIGDLADCAGGDINPVQFFQHVLDVPGGGSFGVHGDDLLFNLIAVFLQELGLKLAVAVPRHPDLGITPGGAHGTVIVTIAVITRVAPRSFIALVAQLVS